MKNLPLDPNHHMDIQETIDFKENNKKLYKNFRTYKNILVKIKRNSIRTYKTF